MVRTVKWFHWERRTCTQLNLKYTWDCQKGKEIIHGKESVYMEDGIRLMIFESSKLVPGRAWMVCYGAGQWRRQWHPTPVLLPGKSHGWRSLVGYSPRGHEELDTTERLHFHFHLLEKEMATHSSVLAWRIPGTGEPGGLPSLGLHRVGHNWSNLAAAASDKYMEWFREQNDITLI